MTEANKIIALAANHSGFEMKSEIADFLKSAGYEVLDLGTHSADRVDYPDYGHALAEAIASGKAGRGIALCRTGMGMNIVVNRNSEVRAGLCHDATAAREARQVNDANVLVLGAGTISIEAAIECVQTFLNTTFDERGRYAECVKKLGNASQNDSTGGRPAHTFNAISGREVLALVRRISHIAQRRHRQPQVLQA